MTGYQENGEHHKNRNIGCQNIDGCQNNIQYVWIVEDVDSEKFIKDLKFRSIEPFSNDVSLIVFLIVIYVYSGIYILKRILSQP